MMNIKRGVYEKKHRAQWRIVWRIRLEKSCIKGQVNQGLADLWVITTSVTVVHRHFYVLYNHLKLTSAMTHTVWVNLEIGELEF